MYVYIYIYIYIYTRPLGQTRRGARFLEIAARQDGLPTDLRETDVHSRCERATMSKETSEVSSLRCLVGF